VIVSRATEGWAKTGLQSFFISKEVVQTNTDVAATNLPDVS
jgi:hypothetical protein